MGGEDTLEQLLREAKSGYKSLKEEILDSQTQIERLLSRVWRNPYEVLLLEPDAGEEAIKANFNHFRLALHPDKCPDPRSPAALAVVTQAHASITDPAKRKIYQRILREAFDKTVFRREAEDRQRLREGLPPLSNESFRSDLQLVTRRLFDEIEDKRAELVKLDEGLARRRKQDLELLVLREEYKLQTEEEWDKTRDERVKRWQAFKQRAPRIGQRGGDDSIKFSSKVLEGSDRF